MPTNMASGDGRPGLVENVAVLGPVSGGEHGIPGPYIASEQPYAIKGVIWLTNRRKAA